MKRRKTHHEDITIKVLCILIGRVKPGTPVTDEQYNIAYEIVWAQQALETIEWKAMFISPRVQAEFSHGR